MAEVSPVSSGTAGFVPDGSLFTGEAAIGDNMLTVGTVRSHLGYRLQVYYFDGVDEFDTWTSGIPNIAAIAWQPRNMQLDLTSAHLTDQATGEVTFDTETTNSRGWLWILRKM